MSYLKFLKNNMDLVPLLEEIGRKELIQWEVKGERNRAKAIFTKSTNADVNKLLEFLREKQMLTNITEIYISGQILKMGPKIFRPTVEQCEALENTRLNFGFAEYNQPFPAFIVEFPNEYAERKLVPDPVKGGSHQPDCVAVVHDKPNELIAAGVYFNDGQCANRLFWLRYDEKTLEDAFKDDAHNFAMFDDSLPFSEQEKYMTKRAMCTALNACMLLTTLGSKKLPPENAGYFQRVNKYISKEKDPAKLRGLYRERRLVPELFEFEQNIVLRTKKEYSKNNESGHGKPHWHFRSGHYTSQPFGPKSSLRKRLWIAPVLINADLMTAEEQGTTQSVYTIPKGNREERG